MRAALCLPLAVMLTSCTTSPEVAGGAKTSIRTGSGTYSITDNPGAKRLQVKTTIGSGSEAAASGAADQYLNAKGCKQTDRLEMSAGLTQGSYLVSYECPIAPQSLGS